MQTQLLEWIQIDEEISKKYKEIEVLRQKRNQLEVSLKQYVTQHNLINKTVRTTSGKQFVFRERKDYESISQKFLKKALINYFRKVPTEVPTAESIFLHILMERTFQKILEICKK